MGKVESGYCRVGDQCLIMPNWTFAEITNIYCKGEQVESCRYDANVQLQLKTVEGKVSVLLLLMITF